MEKLELSNRQLDGDTLIKEKLHPSPQLLFLTTIRDPSDRLLSAYTFFALTVSNKVEGDAESFYDWISNNLRRARRYRPGDKAAFRSNTARYNHIVWRFSGGKLSPKQSLEEREWKPSYELAIRALSQQDLILPMDIMTKDEGKEALRRLLGWDRFNVKGRAMAGDKKAGHVVTTGGIKNSNAREFFNKDEYRALWEGNWLDNILCLWCKAVFLARLHCEDIIAD